MKKYLIFKFDSRNTGYYFDEQPTLKKARTYAKMFSKTRIDDQSGKFVEAYENGKLVAWAL